MRDSEGWSSREDSNIKWFGCYLSREFVQLLMNPVKLGSFRLGANEGKLYLEDSDIYLEIELAGEIVTIGKTASCTREACDSDKVCRHLTRVQIAFNKFMKERYGIVTGLKPLGRPKGSKNKRKED